MTTNYVLVDFENVQPESVSALAGGAYHVLVFIGAAQAKGRISFELSHSIQMLGANAEYVQMARSGPNAMDMHIAYYIGKLLEQRPEAQIDVVSRDTDFDPLLEFLSARGFKVRRVKAIAEIVKRRAPKAAAPKPPVRSAVQKAQGPKKQAAPKSPSPKSQPPKAQPQKTLPPRPPASEPYDKLDSIVKQLRSMSGKPANRRKLAQTITAYLRHHGGAPDARVVEEYIDELIRRKVVTVAGTKLNYTLG